MVNRRRLGVMVVAILILGLVTACGGKTKSTTTPDDSGSGDDTACEPGRCLPDISARVEDRRPEARACYEEGLKRLPDLEGRLIINFEINPDGTVADASQSAQDDQIMDEEVVACIADVIKGITFAKSERGKRSRAFHRYEFNK
ncbi:MAG TPA: AgmX/PglI C-terminal domain-containing protein [Kofleriaceae bacterium]|nr:AgmX/PglI C-terminal domain-containing protein [Kofleriaceae bacterium]